MDKKELPCGLRVYNAVKRLLNPGGKKTEKTKPNRFTAFTLHQTMQWEGWDREYYLYVPPESDASTPRPLYVGLHGLTGHASTLVNHNLFSYFCDLQNGLLAFPQGLEDLGMTGWNAGVEHFVSGRIHQLHKDYDDVGFIMAVIDELSYKYHVDQERIYVFGFSMGGFMANRLAIECGDRFRAVCSSNGTLGNLLWNAKPIAPVNILHIHGTADHTVQYDPDIKNPHKPHGLGAEQLVDYWRVNSRCAPEPSIYDYPHVTDNDISFQRVEYKGGLKGAKTVLIKVNNGEHRMYDGSDYDISSTIEMLRFFETAAHLN